MILIVESSSQATRRVKEKKRKGKMLSKLILLLFTIPLKDTQVRFAAGGGWSAF